MPWYDWLLAALITSTDYLRLSGAPEKPLNPAEKTEQKPRRLSDRIEVRITALPWRGIGVGFHPNPAVPASAHGEVLETLDALVKPYANAAGSQDAMVKLSLGLRAFLDGLEDAGRLAPAAWRELPGYLPLMPGGGDCRCGMDDPEDAEIVEAIRIRNSQKFLH